ncbi:hypothetical protein MRB53_039212 [Persea americana]|nr:hypothetical protein MRB53_039212 [Persea americana]
MLIREAFDDLCKDREFLLREFILHVMVGALLFSKHMYKKTIERLNSLQSNAATINALRASGNLNKNAIPEMRSWLKRAGVSQDDVDELKIIHVAGTKGKGSTCAMIASILSNYRLAYGRTPRIGLYTSPHLKSVRERIQVDGAPIPEEDWTTYFDEVWNKLDSKPVYFRFLTILAFHTFIQECVDVTLDSIAWHKGGIFKKGVPAFTVPQPDTAMKVLRDRATERRTTLEVVDIHPALPSLGLEGDFQKSNASLAITLANEYLKTQGVDENLSKQLPAEFIKGLQDVKWPGRCERRIINGREWCLDGGHTNESLALTAECINNAADAVESLQVQHDLAKVWLQLRNQEAEVVGSIQEAIARATTARVLVTGSLHLVGGAMTILDG